MRDYELMYIARPDLDEEANRSLLDRIQKAIADKGGVVQQVDVWGRRRLAYEIAGQREGHYTVLQFRSQPAAVHELERLLSLTDTVLRHLIVQREKVGQPDTVAERPISR